MMTPTFNLKPPPITTPSQADVEKISWPPDDDRAALVGFLKFILSTGLLKEAAWKWIPTY
jgi:hypothetical protein